MIPTDWTVPSSIITGSIAVGTVIYKLVRATYGVSEATKDNSKALAVLSQDIKTIHGELTDRITVAQHADVLTRIAAIEREVMHRGNERDDSETSGNDTHPGISPSK